MHVFEVGKPFIAGRAMYEEDVKFDFTDTGGLLILTLSGLKREEIDSVDKGKVKIGQLYLQDVLFLLFKFEGLPWMDAPYTAHLSKDLSFPLTAPEEGLGYAFQTILVNADTGLIESMRMLGLPNEWSKRFRNSLIDQKEQTFDREKYDEKIKLLYGNYTTEKLKSLVDFKDWVKFERGLK